jgi:predicted O-methyltransferase YrrM
MLDRLKAAARGKLQRAMAEVVESELVRVETELERIHQRLETNLAGTTATKEALDRLSGHVTDRAREMSDRLHEMSDRLHELSDRLHELEQRPRRDIAYALDTAAANETAAFVLEHMPKVPVFRHPHDTLRFALDQIRGEGVAVEFGVASGTTLKIIAETVSSDRKVVGFDVFTGLPETWRTGFPAGEFAQKELPDVPGARLVVGLFDDTLPRFLGESDEQIAFVHLDVDLYSSTTTVLKLINDRLAPNAVLLFDEFFNYPGWQRHEFRAWNEFVAKTGRTFDYLAYTANNEQVAIRLH